MGLVVVAILSAHLLLVNLAMAGPLLALWLECRGSRGFGAAALPTAASLLRCSAASLVGAILLGTGLLALFWRHPQQQAYFDAFRLIPPSRLWLGLAELAFYFACLGAYLFAIRRSIAGRGMRVLVRIFPIAAATDLMFHFPPLFAIVSILAARPQQRSLFIAGLERRDYYSLLFDPEVLSRVIHVWLAGVAVAGAVVMLIATKTVRADHDESTGAIAVSGARWAASASLLQVPVGLWLAFNLPDAARQSLLGGNAIDTSLFLAAVLLSLYLLHLVAGASLVAVDRRDARRIALAMSLIIFLMTAVLQRASHPTLTARVTANRMTVPIRSEICYFQGLPYHVA
jgi:hypothetical protein